MNHLLFGALEDAWTWELCDNSMHNKQPTQPRRNNKISGCSISTVKNQQAQQKPEEAVLHGNGLPFKCSTESASQTSALITTHLPRVPSQHMLGGANSSTAGWHLCVWWCEVEGRCGCRSNNNNKNKNRVIFLRLQRIQTLRSLMRSLPPTATVQTGLSWGIGSGCRL